MSEAATAFSAERYMEARSILGPVVTEVPDLPEARELYGLTLYRLGRWRDAAKELNAFVELSGGSTEQEEQWAQQGEQQQEQQQQQQQQG